jgi:hypothetical protein
MRSIYADSPGYLQKKLDQPQFFEEPRNITLMFCADGVNPWKKERSASFLVCVFVNMNLPPDMRMKHEHLILLGITDCKPGNSQMVYQMIVDELQELWGGVPCWDSSSPGDGTFKLRAMMLLGLMDFPGLVDASLQVDEGSFGACPKCPLQGIYVTPIKDVKYARHLHQRSCTERGVDPTPDLDSYTHDDLVRLADEIMVSGST